MNDPSDFTEAEASSDDRVALTRDRAGNVCTPNGFLSKEAYEQAWRDNPDALPAYHDIPQERRSSIPPRLPRRRW